MKKSVFPKFVFNRRLFLVVAVWILGMFLGFVFSLNLCKDPRNILNYSLLSSISAPVMFLGLALPYILTAVAQYLRKSRYLVLIIFIKSFLFFYSSFAIISTYSDAGWLARLLLMFSGSANMVLLLWFWFICVIRNNLPIKHLLFCMTVSTALGYVDFTVVSPIISQIITI